MENLLQGIPNVVVRIDDILIAGKTGPEHLSSLSEVLARLEKAGIRLKRQKCVFLAPEVVYLGHRINQKGIQPLEDKIRAIRNSPRPTNLKELQAFLGMLNYYSCYIPNVTNILTSLHELLTKDAKWIWSSAREDAWKKAKSALHSSQLLVHFDTEKELILACDASPYGLGSVLSHIMEDGTERPIAYASRSLSPAERNYSQLDKEAAALMFGVRKFHQYLYGKHFKAYTDHKPLLGLFRSDKAIPHMGSPRIQRWALFLSGYTYELQYREGSKNGNADCLSRLPIKETVTNVPVPGDLMQIMDHLDNTPVKVSNIARWTARDSTLSEVLHCVKQGWPDHCPRNELHPFFTRKLELSTQDDCILWGARVVIPNQGREKLLEALHEGHPGMVRMKQLARSYLWWPGLDSDIEKKVKSCLSCQLHASLPPAAPLHPWEWPSRPWSRLHIDYAGPFLGHMFLVVVDAHSKWLEVLKTNSSTSAVTIQKLRECFATHGLPDAIVSDNGTAFTSEEFALFVTENGIKHITAAPKHPASNGLAERYVRTFKEGMKKMEGSPGSIEAKLSKFLLAYRTTPQGTTGQTPCELLMKRKLKTKLDLINPLRQNTTRMRVEGKQHVQKYNHDRHSIQRGFQTADPVFVKNFSPGPKWLSGTILGQSGPVSYTVQLSDSGVCRRHVDHIRSRLINSGPQLPSNLEPDSPIVPQHHPTVEVPNTSSSSGDTTSESTPAADPQTCTDSSATGLNLNKAPSQTFPTTTPSLTAATPRRSVRNIITPGYLKDYMVGAVSCGVSP